ncbi:MAG: hypothetical protein KIS92_07380 [Planctomycetota bacterium]|nr:hypothetical protein [Planctomycetota bacterium]
MIVPNLNVPDLAATPAVSSAQALPHAAASKAGQAEGYAPVQDEGSPQDAADEGETMDFESALEAAVAISAAPAKAPAAPVAQESGAEKHAEPAEPVAGLAERAGRAALSETERALATVTPAPASEPAEGDAFVLPREAANAYQAMEISASDAGQAELPEGFTPVTPRPVAAQAPAPASAEPAAEIAAGFPAEESGIEVVAKASSAQLAAAPQAEQAEAATEPAETAKPAVQPQQQTTHLAPDAPAPDLETQAVAITQANETAPSKETGKPDARAKADAPVAGDAASVVQRADISSRYGVRNSEGSAEKAPESLRGAAEKNLEGGRAHAPSTPLSSERGAEGISPRQALPEENEAAREIPAYAGASAQAEKNIGGPDAKNNVSPTAPRAPVEQVQQVAQAAREGLANGKRVLEIELKPEGMGSVTLRITGNPNSTHPANELRLDISVSSQEAHSLLSRHLDDLKSVLGKWDVSLSPVATQQVRGAQEGSNGSAPDGRNPQQDGQRRPQYQPWFERREAGAEAFSEHFDSAVGN